MISDRPYWWQNKNVGIWFGLCFSGNLGRFSCLVFNSVVPGSESWKSMQVLRINSSIQGKWDAVCRHSTCIKSLFSADDSPLISTIVLRVMAASEVLLFWASASVLCCNTISSLSFCSTFSEQSLTYSLCSAKLPWSALELLLWKQRPCRCDMSVVFEDVSRLKPPTFTLQVT